MSTLATMLVSTDILPEREPNERFHHLQELVDVLPDQEELAQRLARSVAAQRVMECERTLSSCETAFIKAEEAVASARTASIRAREAGDETAAQAQEQTMLFHSEQLGLKLGPVEEARAALQQALTDGDFADVIQAEEAVLSPEEEIAIAAQIATYRGDYAATLAACEAEA